MDELHNVIYNMAIQERRERREKAYMAKTTLYCLPCVKTIERNSNK